MTFPKLASVRFVSRCVGLLVALLAAPLSSSGQEWATRMFETTTHDFGSVARGAKTEFAFVLTNGFQEQVHIASVRSSCGCTNPRIVKDTLDTYEKSAIVAELNTTSFQGAKNATITVVIDRPYRAEVQLRVSAYIRTDIVIEPGECAFGDVDQGKVVERRLSIVHAGRSDWQIVDVRAGSDRLEAELSERERNGQRVVYDLVLRLKDDVGLGPFREQIHLVTNDRNLTTVPLMVEGRVRGSIAASPNLLSLGALAGGSSTKKVFLRGQGAFAITAVRATDPAIRFEIPEGEKESQFLPITVASDGSGRQVDETVTIETTLGSVQVKVTGELN